jgi:hypothetical protein
MARVTVYVVVRAREVHGRTLEEFVSVHDTEESASRAVDELRRTEWHLAVEHRERRSNGHGGVYVVRETELLP